MHNRPRIVLLDDDREVLDHVDDAVERVLDGDRVRIEGGSGA
jgi:hypothetical protein